MRTFVIVFLIIAYATNTNAATRYSVATGNWNSTSTWSSTSGGTAGASYPVAGDVVYIERGYTVTITATGAACATVTIGTGNGKGVLTLRPPTTAGGNFTFTISGNVDVASNGTFAVTNQLVLNTHTVTIGGNLVVDGSFRMVTTVDDYASVVFNGTSQQTISGSGDTCSFYNLTASNTNANGLVLTRTISLAAAGTQTAPAITVTAGDIFNITNGTCTEVSTGTCAVNGTLGIGSSGTLTVGTTLSGSGTLTNAGTLNIPGTCTITTLTVSTSGNTVNYSGSGAQTLRTEAYSNLTLSGSGTKTISGTTTIAVTFTISGTAQAALTQVLIIQYLTYILAVLMNLMGLMVVLIPQRQIKITPILLYNRLCNCHIRMYNRNMGRCHKFGLEYSI